ncbi:MAG: DMT family transporter [Hyphomicrobiales bacterium]|nr:DMT family transporter [Hyphomicrobiales bacterium]
MITTRPGFTDYILLVTLAAIFGNSFMLVGVVVEEIPSVTLVTLRLVIAAVIFLVAMGMAGQRLPSLGRIWFVITAVALFGNVAPFFLIAWGQEKVDAGLAAILIGCMPLMTIVMAHFVTSDEKLTPFKILGFCLGLSGVVVMIGYDKLGTLGEETIRQYAIVGAALCYAISAIISKALVTLPRMSMMAAVMFVSCVVISPVGLVTGETMEVVSGSWPSIEVTISMVFLGIVPTVIGTIMIFEIITRQGASFLSQINFMIPVFGVLWSMAFLSEVLSPNAVGALALILAGVAVARINPKPKIAHVKEINS